MTDPGQTQLRTHEQPIKPTAFSITVEPRRDSVRIAPRGELDIATVGQLKRELAEIIAAGFTRVTIDLRSVEFIDSSGLHALLDAHTRAQRGDWELTIIQGPPAVQRLFAVTSTLERLPFIANGRPAMPESSEYPPLRRV